MVCVNSVKVSVMGTFFRLQEGTLKLRLEEIGFSQMPSPGAVTPLTAGLAQLP